MTPALCAPNDSGAKGKITGGEQLEEAKQNIGSAKIGKRVSTASTSKLLEGELAGLIHLIQTIQFNILARYPITTTVQP